jgi:UDP:flavonoid glycosyltransferase YjiC (YdhE family)
MHALLATVGSDGDVFPHLGLGAALRARGHDVTLAAPEPYRACALALGLAFCPLVTAEEVGRMLADPDLWHPLKSGRMMARWGGPLVPRQYALLAERADAPNTVLIANPGALAARLVQEKFRVPTVSLLIQPGLVPSSTAPPEMPAGLTLPSWSPGWVRSLYWRALDAAGYLFVARSLNRVRAALGLAPVRRLFRWWLSPDLVIGLFPAWYAAPQPDWPAQLRLAGFARFDGVRDELAGDLRSFCGDGTAPVAFTLGTGMAHAGRFFRAAVAACVRSGVRGLLLTKYPHLVPSQLPPSVRHCAFAPFRQLLPLCGAVVHHGGVGTTAAALQAGCPQLVLPLAWDQPDNAARVVRLGVGRMLGARQRTAGHLARALGRLLVPEIRTRCQAVAALAGDGDGVDVAAGWVEELAGTGSVAPTVRSSNPTQLPE